MKINKKKIPSKGANNFCHADVKSQITIQLNFVYCSFSL